MERGRVRGRDGGREMVEVINHIFVFPSLGRGRASTDSRSNYSPPL